MSHRAIGTGSGHVADGAHTHAYASTDHDATHKYDGSDPLALVAGPNDGTGIVKLLRQTTWPSDPADSDLDLHSVSIADSPILAIRTSNRLLPVDPHFGSDARFSIHPGTGTAVTQTFGPAPTSTNLTHPTATTQYGYHTNIASTAGANTRGNIDTHVAWFRGDTGIRPWLGARSVCRFCMSDASYANSGASTGTRIRIGFSDQASSVLVNSDNPTGTRFVFEYVNVNGGRVQTTFRIGTRDGTTENLQDTGVSFTQNKWMDIWLHMMPWGQLAWELVDVEANDGAGASLASGTTTTNIPPETTALRYNVAIQTINAVARNLKFRRLAIEGGTDWVA